MRKRAIYLIVSLFILLQLAIPYPAYSDEAPNPKYQMISWVINAGEGSAITVRYKGSDGIPLRVTFPLPSSLIKDHANDPTWVGPNSAGPFVAYVKEFGNDRNIQMVFGGVEYFDPILLDALKGQGVSLSQFGVSNPKAGEPIILEAAKKNIVGLGIPAWFGSTSNASAPKPAPTPAPAPLPVPKQESPQPTKTNTNTQVQTPSDKTPAQAKLTETTTQEHSGDTTDPGIDPERVNPTVEGGLTLPYLVEMKEPVPTEPETNPIPYVAGGVGVLVVGGVTIKTLATKKALGGLLKFLWFK